MGGRGWEGFSEEELMENGDYIDEVRFGGDASSDEAIKERIYAMDDEDFDRWDEGG